MKNLLLCLFVMLVLSAVTTSAQGIKVGISDYAQSELGDVVFVELPQINDEVSAGQSFANIESVKAVSEIYAPVSGTVVAINSDLEVSPEKVNEDPYTGGWIAIIKPSEGNNLESLLTAAEYQDLVSEISK